jgi:hypothetical protein
MAMEWGVDSKQASFETRAQTVESRLGTLEILARGIDEEYNSIVTWRFNNIRTDAIPVITYYDCR